MKTIIIFFLIFFTVSPAYSEKGKEVELYISLQQRILEIAKRHPEPFKPKSSDLTDEVQTEIKRLNLAKLETKQLYRLGIACSLAAYPQNAGDQRYDLIFDNVAWKCVHYISLRPGHEASHYLKSMKDLFGADGAPSFQFKEYIQRQSNLKR